MSQQPESKVFSLMRLHSEAQSHLRGFGDQAREAVTNLFMAAAAAYESALPEAVMGELARARADLARIERKIDMAAEDTAKMKDILTGIQADVGTMGTSFATIATNYDALITKAASLPPQDAGMADVLAQASALKADADALASKAAALASKPIETPAAAVVDPKPVDPPTPTPVADPKPVDRPDPNPNPTPVADPAPAAPVVDPNAPK